MADRPLNLCLRLWTRISSSGWRHPPAAGFRGGTHGPNHCRPWRGLISLLANLLAVALFSSHPPVLAQEAPNLDQGDQGLIPVTLALQWKPQSQFAGYYLARDKGYYRAAGLEMNFLHANTDRGSLRLLTEGEAELATAALSDALLLAPHLVQIAQVVRRDTNLIIGWKDMGIQGINDLDGKPVSYWQGVASTFDAFFTLHHIRPIPIPQYYSINLFLERGVAACAAKGYNDLHRLWQAGIDPEQVTVFRIRDFGVGFPEDGLYAESGWAERHPDLLDPLRQATLRGWRYAQSHPEEAIALVMAETRLARIPTNLPHERWMLRHMLDNIFVPDEEADLAGSLKESEFQRAATKLQSAGLLAQVPDFSRFAPLEGANRD